MFYLYSENMTSGHIFSLNNQHDKMLPAAIKKKNHPINFFQGIPMNSQLSTVRCLKMSTIPRNLVRQTTGQSVPVHKYSIIPFFLLNQCFVIPHKMKNSFFLHIYDLEFSLP